MCNCKKKPRQEPIVITSVAMTPEQLERLELEQRVEELNKDVQDDKQEN